MKFAPICEDTRDHEFRSSVTKHVFMNNEVNVRVTCHQGGLVKIQQEIQEIENDEAYLWMMKHVKNLLAYIKR